MAKTQPKKPTKTANPTPVNRVGGRPTKEVKADVGIHFVTTQEHRDFLNHLSNRLGFSLSKLSRVGANILRRMTPEEIFLASLQMEKDDREARTKEKK
ncbi:MAG: hypothetical protein AB7G11_16105 [Phycisphaerales bacterium]